MCSMELLTYRPVERKHVGNVSVFYVIINNIFLRTLWNYIISRMQIFTALIAAVTTSRGQSNTERFQIVFMAALCLQETIAV